MLVAAAIAYLVHAPGLPYPQFAVGLAAFFGLSGLGLGALGVVLVRGRDWPATAVMTWQALQVLAGVSLAGERLWLGAPLVVAGVTVGVAAAMVRRDALAAS